MKHWIFSTSLSNYRICKKYNVFGVDERYKITAQNHIDPDDLMFFYVKKWEQRKQVLRDPIFIGPWKITNKASYNPNHPAVKEWYPLNTYLYVIPIKPIETKICVLDDVFDKLLFLTNRKRKGKGGGYSDHFQFSIISIREEDFDIILKCTNKKLENFIK